MPGNRHWTSDDDALLRKHYREHGTSWPMWAALLPDRTWSAIVARASDLGVSVHGTRYDEVRRLVKEHYQAEGTRGEWWRDVNTSPARGIGRPMGRAWTRWTPERDRDLARDYGTVPNRVLAERYGTTPGAVESHAWAIGLTRARLAWTDERVETLRATYPILGRGCGPLCGCSRDAAASKAKKMGVYLHVRKRPEPNRERRRVALMVARWCVGHGMHAETVVEECAEWCGCTPAMMRMVLPALLKDEMRRKKRRKRK